MPNISSAYVSNLEKQIYARGLIGVPVHDNEKMVEYIQSFLSLAPDERFLVSDACEFLVSRVKARRRVPFSIIYAMELLYSIRDVVKDDRVWLIEIKQRIGN